MSGVWEIAVVGGEGFVGNEERHGRPRGDEPAHKCGVRGGDVGRHRGNEPEGEAEPGQEPGPDSGAAAATSATIATISVSRRCARRPGAAWDATWSGPTAASCTSWLPLALPGSRS